MRKADFALCVTLISRGGFWSGPWRKSSRTLATSDKTTIVIERQPDGKMRVTSGSWDGEKIFLRDQVLEVRHAVPDAWLHVARKTKAPGASNCCGVAMPTRIVPIAGCEIANRVAASVPFSLIYPAVTVRQCYSTVV
jgi:hypothetical protein